MAEYLVSTGLIWIRPVPGEKPIWVGGNYHVAPAPEIAHRFVNTSTGQDAVDEIMGDVWASMRRDIHASIEQALRRFSSDESLGIVEGSLAG